MKKKIIVGIVMLIVLAVTIVSVGVFSRPDTVPTPMPTLTPTATPRPTPIASPTAPQVIEITAQELITQLQANPNRYKKGTIFQITGVIIENVPFAEYLGPETNGWIIKLDWIVGENNGLGGILPGTNVVVRGRYEVTIGKIVLLKNSSLVSRK